jgi:hypothetical protein
VRRLCATLLLIPAVAGCGGAPGPPTTTLTDGTTVGADRYLADTAAAAAAVREFNSELAVVAPSVTRQALQRVAPRLEPSLSSARLVSQRLSAARLEDQRLEAQRGRDADAFAATVLAMERVHGAAVAGDPGAALAAARELQASVATMRATAASSP